MSALTTSNRRPPRSCAVRCRSAGVLLVPANAMPMTLVAADLGRAEGGVGGTRLPRRGQLAEPAAATPPDGLPELRHAAGRRPDNPPVKTPSTQDTTTEQRTFASVLYDINKGKTHIQLGEELRALVAAVVATGKTGSLTLRLDIKSGGNDESVTITGRIASKVPVLETPASVFFVDVDNNLNRTPPRQGAMFDVEN